ncbi:MAG TPA: hypothetical protein VE130_09770 [Nitrososphaeraceae archaeon]|nr:hypothetical protein [Nitrososphaeraceae archaeon]
MDKTRNITLNFIIVICVILLLLVNSVTSTELFAKKGASSSDSYSEGAGTRSIEAGTTGGIGASGTGVDDHELAAGNL